jgi:hypothetical protein
MHTSLSEALLPTLHTLLHRPMSCVILLACLCDHLMLHACVALCSALLLLCPLLVMQAEEGCMLSHRHQSWPANRSVDK